MHVACECVCVCKHTVQIHNALWKKPKFVSLCVCVRVCVRVGGCGYVCVCVFEGVLRT